MLANTNSRNNAEFLGSLPYEITSSHKSSGRQTVYQQASTPLLDVDGQPTTNKERRTTNMQDSDDARYAVEVESAAMSEIKVLKKKDA